jgi:hypothetical protein
MDLLKNGWSITMNEGGQVMTPKPMFVLGKLAEKCNPKSKKWEKQEYVKFSHVYFMRSQNCYIEGEINFERQNVVDMKIDEDFQTNYEENEIESKPLSGTVYASSYEYLKLHPFFFLTEANWRFNLFNSIDIHISDNLFKFT